MASNRSINVFQQALRHHQSGQLEQAKVLYQRLLQQQPRHSDACHLLGMIASQQGQHAEAETWIRRALHENPQATQAGAYWSNLAVVVQRQGRLQEALEMYDTIFKIQPTLVDSRNNYGLLLQELNRLPEALASFQKALQLRPGFPDSWNNLVQVYGRMGQFTQALKSVDQLLLLHPKDAKAHFNRGNCLVALDRILEAMESFQHAVSLEPDWLDARNNLGSVLRNLGHYDRAQSCYQQVIDRDPHHLKALRNLGQIFLDQGYLEQATAQFKHCLQVEPDDAKSLQQLASIKQHDQADDENLARMEQMYRQPDRDSESRRFLAFGLGKGYEELKQYQLAMQFYKEGNALKRRLLPFDASQEITQFQKIYTLFNKEFIKRTQGQGYTESGPLFIVGLPRSGTSLVEQILASHPQVHGCGELLVLPNLLSTLNDQQGADSFPDRLAGLSRDQWYDLGKQYHQALPVVDEPVCYKTDKLPRNFLYLGIISTMLPQARIIHCVRDPMDNGLSIFKNDFFKGHAYANDLEELALGMQLYQQIMQHWQAVLPNPFIYNLCYEELVQEPHNVIRTMLEFLGLPWSEACLNHQDNRRPVHTLSSVQVRRPIYRDSVGLWKQYREQLAPLEQGLAQKKPLLV